MTTHIVPLPPAIEGVIVQTAPDVAVSVVLPPGKQTVEVSDNGGIRFEYDRPRLAVQQVLLSERGGANFFRLWHLRGQDPLTGTMGGAYAIGNVHPSGDICWGGVRTPDSLRTFQGAFFGSPFNRDLAGGNRPRSDSPADAVNAQVSREWQAEDARLYAETVTLLGPTPEPGPAWFADPNDVAAAAQAAEAYQTARNAYRTALDEAATLSDTDSWHLERRIFGYGTAPVEPNHPLVPLHARMNDAQRVHSATASRIYSRDRCLTSINMEVEGYASWVANEAPPDTAGAAAINRLTPARKSRLRRVVRDTFPALRNPTDRPAVMLWAERLLEHKAHSRRRINAIREARAVFVQRRTAELLAATRPGSDTLADAFRAWFGGGYAVGHRDMSVGLALGGSRYVRLDAPVPAAFVSSETSVRALVPGTPGRWVAGFAVPGPRPKTWNVAVPTGGDPVRFVWDETTNAVAQS